MGIFLFFGCVVEMEDTEVIPEDELDLTEIQVGERLGSNYLSGGVNFDHHFDDIVNAIIDDDRELAMELISSLDREELDSLVDELQLRNVYPDSFEEDNRAVNEDEIIDIPISETSHTYCGGGYWGANWQHESIEQRDSTSGLLYETGPNCYFWAPGADCGTDYDDFMLSFYFGNHAESLSQLRPMLRWYSTHWIPRALIGTMDARVYEQTSGGGRDNYNIYACLDDYFLEYYHTFRMRKY